MRAKYRVVKKRHKKISDALVEKGTLQKNTCKKRLQFKLTLAYSQKKRAESKNQGDEKKTKRQSITKGAMESIEC